MDETIFALSSGAGRAGIAVIRISGSEALDVLARIAGSKPPEREARLRRLRDSNGETLDEALVLWFSESGGFTGETLVELHCHGGTAIVQAVLNFLAVQPGCRMAEPGEFTLRAFQNGRIDLANAEALGDLVNAETEAQRKYSIRMLQGDLHRRVDEWRKDLLRALALVEATIDWADEDVPEDAGPEVRAILDGLISSLERERVASQAAGKLRNGFEVAVIGAPNSGKSSFINHLSGRETAITSPVPGTTRDIVELRYDLCGIPVCFLDTAGLRETDDPVEKEGVRRAVQRAEAADLRLRFEAADAGFPEAFEYLATSADLRVATKSDIFETGENHNISTVTGGGFEDLLEDIREILSARVSSAGVLGHTRQQLAVEAGRDALALARNRLGTASDEVAAEHLRAAARELAKVIGTIGVEDVLENVFANFCLGK